MFASFESLLLLLLLLLDLITLIMMSSDGVFFVTCVMMKMIVRMTLCRSLSKLCEFFQRQ